MERLELKYLATYLPYQLKFSCPFGGLNDEMIGLSESLVITDLNNGSIDCSVDLNYVGENGSKPILRPLSDLTFEDLDKLGKRYGIQVNDEEVHVFRDLDENRNPLEWRYEDIQYLLSRHFDVFGLIEKGLAIDINTLN